MGGEYLALGDVCKRWTGRIRGRAFYRTRPGNVEVRVCSLYSAQDGKANGIIMDLIDQKIAEIRVMFHDCSSDCSLEKQLRELVQMVRAQKSAFDHLRKNRLVCRHL